MKTLEDLQLKDLLDVEDRVEITHNKRIPEDVYIGERDQKHFCFSMNGIEGFLCTFQSPAIGKAVAINIGIEEANLKTMQYRKVKFEEALAIALTKNGISGVAHFFDIDDMKVIRND